MKPRILFVEDEATLRAHLTEALSDEYCVDSAGSGTEALRAVMRARPDLIVTDIVMPEMDGVELLKALRSVSSTQGIPILLISGRAKEEQRIEGFREGADGYLAKPYSERELRALIGSMIASGRQRAEVVRQETLAEAERKAVADRAALLESIADAFYALDGQYRFTYVNQRALDYYGKTREELLGRSIWEAFPVAEGSLVQEQYERVLRTQTSAAFEVQSLLTQRWLELRVYPAGGGLSVYLRDVSARRRAEQALQAALIRLEETDRRKDEFLALLSHELRNPLAPIVNGLTSLRYRIAAESDLQHILAIMDRQLTHLVRLVDDLLDMRRITHGTLELHLQKIRLVDVLANAIEGCRSLSESRKHTLTTDVRADDLIVNGDGVRLEQVFTNLIQNSVKYTEPGGRIQISVDREGEHGVVVITDNGIGIPPDALDPIFEMFTRVAGHPHGGSGFGIGLALVRSIVQLHGGTVRAASGGPRMGSTFTVRLPLPGAAAQTLAAQAAEFTPRGGKGLRILVVDDNRDAANSLRDLLELKEYGVWTAATGEEAVEAALTVHPQVIFMDLGLPGIDGVETARRIHAMPGLRDVSIIALTGWGQPSDRARTQEAGMIGHLLKPVSAEALEQALAKVPAAEARSQ